MASAGGLKRSFVVDLDRADHASFHGLHAMLLQGGALDPTKAREALAFTLFREAGVPRRARRGRGDADRAWRASECVPRALHHGRAR